MRLINVSIVIMLLALVSCNPKGANIGGGLVEKDAEELRAAMIAMSDKPIRTFYTKASTNFVDSSRSVNFKTSIRSIIDSISNMDIKYASIPLVNAVVTNDSLKVVNRRDKCWVLNSIEALKQQFGMEFTLNDLEDLLLGSPLGFTHDKTYHQLEDQNYYVLSSHSKKEIKKVAKDGDKTIIVRYFLTSEMQLKRIVIESTKDDAIIAIEYKGHELIQDVLIPTGMTIDIKIGKKQPINFEMEYSKSRINEAEEIFFVIPEDYEKCDTK